MDSVRLRRKLAASRWARVAAFPVRAGQVTRFNALNIAASTKWLFTSREHTNYTYHLTSKNLDYLAWWCSVVSGTSIAKCRTWIDEINTDDELKTRIARSTSKALRRGLSDDVPRFGRRAGWYCLVRATEPEHVVETGTDKGIGSLVLARALERNGHGRLTTIDINEDSGYMLAEAPAGLISRRIGDSVSIIRELEDINLFLHDSDHSHVHEAAEFEAVSPCLAPGALVLSDNSELTSALSDWAGTTNRRFLYFAEEPLDHWYPGGGIGASW